MENGLTEESCLKCGKCCYRRYFKIIDGVIHIRETGIPCEHLGQDNLCKIYETRACMSAEEMKSLGLLPEGCGYGRVSM